MPKKLPPNRNPIIKPLPEPNPVMPKPIMPPDDRFIGIVRPEPIQRPPNPPHIIGRPVSPQPQPFPYPKPFPYDEIGRPIRPQPQPFPYPGKGGYRTGPVLPPSDRPIFGPVKPNPFSDFFRKYIRLEEPQQLPETEIPSRFDQIKKLIGS